MFRKTPTMKSRLILLLMLLSTAMLLGVAGCTHSCLTRECDRWDVYRKNKIPPALEVDAAAGIVPTVPTVNDPVTVSDPEREPWYISLQECFAMALERGTIGGETIRAPGQVSDDLVAFAGRGVTGTDSVRALALDPAIVGAGIDQALARFDPVWATGLSWNAV